MKLTLQRQIDLWFVLSLLIFITICPVTFPGTLVTLALFASLGMLRYAVAREISGRKRAEEALGLSLQEAETSAKKFQELLEAVPNPGAEVEPEARIARVSETGTIPTDCNTVLEEVLAHLKPAIDAKCARVTRDLLPTILYDRPQLVELFRTLIGNAIAFNNHESPHVHVSAGRSGAEWVFSVYANSIGLIPGDGKRLFSISESLHEGLAVCKDIVDSQGGRIWLESEQGKDTTFFFTIRKWDTRSTYPGRKGDWATLLALPTSWDEEEQEKQTQWAS